MTAFSLSAFIVFIDEVISFEVFKSSETTISFPKQGITGFPHTLQDQLLLSVSLSVLTTLLGGVLYLNQSVEFVLYIFLSFFSNLPHAFNYERIDRVFDF